jgi:hypothetical protein
MKAMMKAVVFAVLVGAALLSPSAIASEEHAILLSFNPQKNLETRFMFILSLNGGVTEPGKQVSLPYSSYGLETVYKDTVLESLYGLNKHQIEFYDYNVHAVTAGSTRENPSYRPGRGGRSAGGAGGGGGGGGGGRNPGGRGRSSGFGDGTWSGSQDINNNPGGVDQTVPGGGVGGGGGNPRQPNQPPQTAGTNPEFNLDSILINNLTYVTTKTGQVVDVGGLDLLSKVSKNAVQEGDIVSIDITHVFEWTHLLVLPDYPVYKEDMWFATLPMHVPGLPKPIMTKFVYRLLDFRVIGSRKVAVIDMQGIEDFDQEWTNKTDKYKYDYKAFGNQSIASRYFFDYEKGEIFGIERPPLIDYKNLTVLPGALPHPLLYALYGMPYPGLVVNDQFRFYTYKTDISGRPSLTPKEPEFTRRFYSMAIFGQLEAE